MERVYCYVSQRLSRCYRAASAPCCSASTASGAWQDCCSAFAAALSLSVPVCHARLHIVLLSCACIVLGGVHGPHGCYMHQPYPRPRVLCTPKLWRAGSIK